MGQVSVTRDRRQPQRAAGRGTPDTMAQRWICGIGASWLLGRSASEFRTLCPVARAHGRGGRRQRGLMLATLPTPMLCWVAKHREGPLWRRYASGGERCHTRGGRL